MPIVGSGGGGNLEGHNEFSLDGWCESRGGKCVSLTWSVSGDTTQVDVPEHLQKIASTLMEFDAEKKQLYVSKTFCKLFGVEVVITGDD
jgi:hypothetical protein